jgi:hypothetical protein
MGKNSSFISSLIMTVQFILENPQNFKEYIAPRIPTRTRIIPPFRVKVKSFKTKVYASIQTIRTETRNHWPGT